MQWRWLTDAAPGEPQFNMDADSRLFDALREGRDKLPSVRIYFWAKPCVTFGRLQNIDAVRSVFPDLPLVRRPTGGLAVRHDNDLTISIVTRTEWLPAPARPGVLSSYRSLVAGLIETFIALGIPAGFGGQETPSKNAHDVNCFSRLAACDVMNTKTREKIIGCAQRREAGVILQQMSVPGWAKPGREQFLMKLQERLTLHLSVDNWLAVDTRKAL